jgi:hypothetical protein
MFAIPQQRLDAIKGVPIFVVRDPAVERIHSLGR